MEQKHTIVKHKVFGFTLHLVKPINEVDGSDTESFKSLDEDAIDLSVKTVLDNKDNFDIVQGGNFSRMFSIHEKSGTVSEYSFQSITMDDVFGRFNLMEHKCLSKGMIIARGYSLTWM